IPTDESGPAPDAGVPAVDGGIAPGDLPTPLLQFDPAYICGEIGSPATGIRIEGLDHDARYWAVLAGVDEAGNGRGVTPGFTIHPLPATDFWEDLHEQGSDAKGGFCLIADTYGDGSGPGGAITRAMRGFRDRELASSAIGRAFTRFYYAHLAGAGAW